MSFDSNRFMASVYFKEGHLNHLWDLNTISSFDDDTKSFDEYESSNDLFFGITPSDTESFLFNNNINKVEHYLGYINKYESSFNTKLLANSFKVNGDLICNGDAKFHNFNITDSDLFLNNIELYNVDCEKLDTSHTFTSNLTVRNLHTNGFISNSINFQSVNVDDFVIFNSFCFVNNATYNCTCSILSGYINSIIVFGDIYSEVLEATNVFCEKCEVPDFGFNIIQNSDLMTYIDDNSIKIKGLAVDKTNVHLTENIFINNSFEVNDLYTNELNANDSNFHNATVMGRFITQHKAFLHNTIIVENMKVNNKLSHYVVCENAFISELTGDIYENNSKQVILKLFSENMDNSNLNTLNVKCNSEFYAFECNLNSVYINQGGVFNSVTTNNIYLDANLFATRIEFEDYKLYTNSGTLYINDCISLNSRNLQLVNSNIVFENTVKFESKSNISSVYCEKLTCHSLFFEDFPF